MGSLLHLASSNRRRPRGPANCPMMIQDANGRGGIAVIQKE